MRIAVVVAWDGRRPEWLSDALGSIGAQVPKPDELCLVIDVAVGNDPVLGSDHLAAQGWTVHRGRWRDPAGARNEGFNSTQAPWVVFWDADNVMPAGFIRASVDAIAVSAGNVGVVYSDIEYVDQHLRNGSRWRVPDFDYWTLRAGNYIDTASAWRREAVELADGWTRGLQSYEDYALALDITRRGWVAQRRSGPPIVMRQHETSRSNRRVRDGLSRGDLFDTRSLGILSLLSGRTSTYDRWENFLHTADLPRRTSLYVVDNGGSSDFTHRVQQTMQDLAAEHRFKKISVEVRPVRYPGPEDEPYFVRERHLHIARLYADVVPAIGEDLILTLEDDVEPPTDALRRLTEQLAGNHWGRVGAVAAAYDMGGDFLCAGRADGGWGTRILWSELTDEAIDVGSVGGSCTLWANWALVGQPVLFRWHDGLGWDGSLCTSLSERGDTIQVHGGVRCTHHVHGTVRPG